MAENQAPLGRRGVAMLLVMVALVVCMMLITGFLATQGTANGIAVNEQEYVRAQRAAETGVNMCAWLVRNRPDWRSAMAPSAWLNAQAIGSAYVTVNAADGAGAQSFLTDPRRAVIFTSIGSYNGRSAQLQATFQPTGGGAVFYAGNFCTGQILLQNNTVIDSYNSAVNAYSQYSAAANAPMGTSSTLAGALTMQDTSDLFGTFSAGRGAVLANAVSIASTAVGPSAMSTATETRTPGEVIPPNTAGMAPTGSAYTSSAFFGNAPSPGTYGNFTLKKNTLFGLAYINFPSSGTYWIQGDFTINDSNTTMNVTAGNNVALYVTGNVTIKGTIDLASNATLTIYFGKTLAVNSGTVGHSSTTTTALMLYGLKTATAVSFTQDSRIFAGLFAPQAAVLLQDTSEFYGGIVSGSLQMTNYSRLHWDDAMKNVVLQPVTNGSAAPSQPIYNITYQWN